MSLQKHSYGITTQKQATFLKGELVSQFLSGTNFCEPEQAIYVSQPTSDCLYCSHCC
ncbi:MAG: hypothetical protein ACPKPY_02945 [Nitrososphaeraceae archaeon]